MWVRSRRATASGAPQVEHAGGVCTDTKRGGAAGVLTGACFLVMGLLIRPRTLPPARLTSELGRRAARAALASGAFTTIRRGALVPTIEGSATWERTEAAALAAIAAVATKLTNGAAVSHASAALLHGLWVTALPDLPEVTQRTKQNSHGARTLKRYSCPKLPEDAVTEVDGVRVTTIERTIADCARLMHPRDALAVADSGMRALVRPDRARRDRDVGRIAELRGRLLDLVEHGPPRGRRQARAVIAAADPYAESPRETVLRWIAVSRGLPAPSTQVEVRTREGTFYVDLGWRWVVPRADGTVDVVVLLVEYDGDLKYLPGEGIVRDAAEASAAIVAEKRREDLIREDPAVRMLRFSRPELRDPDAVFRRLLAAVPAGARAALEPIPDLLGTPR